MDNYEVSVEMANRLEELFTYHTPKDYQLKDDQLERYVKLRYDAKMLAYKIVKNTPQSREQSLAFTHLEECIFYVDAAIVRNE